MVRYAAFVKGGTGYRIYIGYIDGLACSVCACVRLILRKKKKWGWKNLIGEITSLVIVNTILISSGVALSKMA